MTQAELINIRTTVFRMLAQHAPDQEIFNMLDASGVSRDDLFGLGATVHDVQAFLAKEAETGDVFTCLGNAPTSKAVH